MRDTLYRPFYRRFVYPWRARRHGHFPFDHLREFEESQYWSAEVLAARRLERLRRLLDHAYETCPFYRTRWEAAGIHPSDIRTLDDVSRLPTVEKKDIQAHRDTMRSSRFAEAELILNQTGGSTGEPLRFYLDRERLKSRAASSIRHDRWAGKDFDTFCLAVWGHPAEAQGWDRRWVDRFKNEWWYRTEYFDTSSLSEARLREFPGVLRKHRPAVLVAYANSIYLIARYLKETGRGDLPPLKSIITSAEVLEPEQRELITAVFGCPVFDRYGCRETSVIASECGTGEGMHLNAECIHIEVVQGERPCAPGERGEFVVTDLLNLGMPLIRYRIRDVGLLLPEACACGRTLPRIRITGGRTTDFLVTPDGRIVSGASLTIHLIALIPGITRAQLVQHRREAITIRVVRGPEFNPDTPALLIESARRFLGAAISIEIEPVDEIPQSASGKHPFSISSIDPFA